ncbi:hypothetical protein CDAR_16271 [Caerostris darwini]|uniref:Uncharacterized protein n=1 Tax=Caerostris darwini TaxID=1538125 RepID=A0AAV4WQL0_9ARAC|nr:hypothetical protein CDAR_16271 [Caerostris darwini]
MSLTHFTAFRKSANVQKSFRYLHITAANKKKKKNIMKTLLLPPVNLSKGRLSNYRLVDHVSTVNPSENYLRLRGVKNPRAYGMHANGRPTKRFFDRRSNLCELLQSDSGAPSI